VADGAKLISRSQGRACVE